MSRRHKSLSTDSRIHNQIFRNNRAISPRSSRSKLGGILFLVVVASFVFLHRAFGTISLNEYPIVKDDKHSAENLRSKGAEKEGELAPPIQADLPSRVEEVEEDFKFLEDNSPSILFVASLSASSLESTFEALKYRYRGSKTLHVSQLPVAVFSDIDREIVEKGSDLFDEETEGASKKLEEYQELLRSHVKRGATKVDKKSNRGKSKTVQTQVVFMYSGWTLLPFIATVFPSSRVLWMTQDVVRWSLHGDYFNFMEPVLNLTCSEQRVDSVCLSRIRKSLSPASATRDEGSLPCSIDEVPALRRAVSWGELHTTIVASLEAIGVSYRVLPLYGNNAEAPFMKLLSEWGLIESESETPSKRIRGSGKQRLLGTALDVERSHERLWTDIVGLQHAYTLSALGFEEAKLGKDIEVHLPQPIDAGTCGTWGCLPKLIIIGAQKASTSEIHAWLGEHPSFAALNGGSEVHFFDCAARGSGQDRDVCSKVRRVESRIVTEARSKHAFSNKHVFGWENMQIGNQPLSDVWPLYARLGNKRKASQSHSPIVFFEKSPAYMDLANPFDVLQLLPSAKLVVSLRDPTERFYSGYHQFCKSVPKQECNLGHFLSLFEAMREKDGVVPDYFRRAFELGKYALYINEWRKAFPDDQIMIVFASHFRKYPQAVMYAIESFTESPGETERHHHYRPFQNADGSWVLSASKRTGKVVHSKEEFNATPIAKQIRGMYRKWNRELYKLLQTSNMMIPKYEMLRDRIPDTFETDLSLPEWLYT